MEVAEGIFYKKGYVSATTSSVAKGARTSESRVFHYFGSKSGLFHAICNEKWRLINERIALEINESWRSEEKLVALCEVLAGIKKEEPRIIHFAAFSFSLKIILEDKDQQELPEFQKFSSLLDRWCQEYVDQHSAPFFAKGLKDLILGFMCRLRESANLEDQIDLIYCVLSN